MTDRLDIQRAMDAFLAGPPDRIADRVIDAALAEIAHTKQRRDLFVPRRIADMSFQTRLLAGAAAVVAVVLGGFLLMPRGGQPGIGGTPSPSPSNTPPASVPPSSTPAPSPTVVRSGTFELPFSITVPSTWTGRVDEADHQAIYRPMSAPQRDVPGAPAVGIDIMIVANAYRDICHPEAGLLDPPLGGTARELADFLLAAEPLHATEVGPTMISGSTALVLDEAFVSSTECVGGMVAWPLSGGPSVIFEAEQKRFFVLERSDRLVVISIVTPNGMFDPPLGGLPEAESALASLTFE